MHLFISKGARRIVGPAHIFYIARHTTKCKTRSDPPFSLHHASMLELIKGTATDCKHILCDERIALCSGIDARCSGIDARCSENGLSDRVLSQVLYLVHVVYRAYGMTQLQIWHLCSLDVIGLTAKLS